MLMEFSQTLLSNPLLSVVKTEFDVILKEGGSNKIGAIKAVRTLKPELGLGEAKQFVESAPQKVLEAANKEDAENAKKVLEEAGCVVEMK